MVTAMMFLIGLIVYLGSLHSLITLHHNVKCSGRTKASDVWFLYVGAILGIVFGAFIMVYPFLDW